MNKRLCVTIAAVIASGLIIFGLATHRAEILAFCTKSWTDDELYSALDEAIIEIFRTEDTSEKATEAKQEMITKSSPINSYQIVVDEDTLVQYIIFEKDISYPDVLTGGITVRVRPDGTPYTIDPEDLDKYEHFSFNNSIK